MWKDNLVWGMEPKIVAEKGETKNLSTQLPFDQFSRQRIVSYLIDESFRKRTKGKSFEIIDIGGYLGKTAEFQPKDSVTILDLFDNDSKNYIKGDATNIKLTDNTFDIACSFDVFEHIPRDKRQAFINESLRISRQGVFLAIPTNVDNKVSRAEVALNDFYLNLTGANHKWLKEHIDYKIPDDKEITQLIDKSGATMVSISSNQIGDWQLMQMLLFISSVIPDVVGDVNNLNTWYNRNILSLDSIVDVGYRKIFFVSKSRKNVELVGGVINKLKNNPKSNKSITINQKTFDKFSNTLSLIGKKYSILLDKYHSSKGKTERDIIDENRYLKGVVKGERRYIAEQQREINNIHTEINNIHTSKAWKMMKFVGETRRLITGSRVKKSRK